jgi:hypothetical protein
MTGNLLQGTAQTPPPPPDPMRMAQELADEIAAKAAQQANEGAPTADQIREQVRAAIEGAREGVLAAQQGRTSTTQVPFDPNNMIPPQAVDISVAFFAMIAFIVVGLPLARAFARRMDRRGEASVASTEVTPRLDRIEQSVDAIAVEIERISENQRYSSRLMSEMRGLPQPAGGWQAEQRVPEPVHRAKEG